MHIITHLFCVLDGLCSEFVVRELHLFPFSVDGFWACCDLVRKLRVAWVLIFKTGRCKSTDGMVN